MRALGVAVGAVALLASSACGGDGDGVATGLEAEVLIEDAADVARLAGTDRLAATLVIRPRAALGEVHLPRLRRIEGGLRVEGVDHRDGFRVRLPALAAVGQGVQVLRSSAAIDLEAVGLRIVGGALDLRQGGRARLDLPVLDRIGGDLRVDRTHLRGLGVDRLRQIDGAVRLERFSAGEGQGAPFVLALPALERIGGELRLRAGPQTTIEAPRLVAVGGLHAVGVVVALRLPGLETIEGDVLIRQASVSEASLARLTVIEGDVLLSGLTFEGRLTLPELRAVGGSFDVQEVAALREIELPVLASLSGWLRLERLPHLGRVRLPSLVEAPSDLKVVSVGGPLALDLARLERVGGSLVLAEQGELAVELPRLRTVVGSLRVRDASLRTLALPALEAVEQHLELLGLTTREARAVDLPALAAVGGHLAFERTQAVERLIAARLARVGGAPGGVALGDVRLVGNVALSALELPALRAIAADLRVTHNPRLDTDAARGWFAGVSVGGRQEICGNRGDLPPCP